MGLHLPGSSFVNPGTPLRKALTAEAVRRRRGQHRDLAAPHAMADIVDREEPSSTASSACWPRAAPPTTRCTWWPWRAAAGILIDWDDFAELSHAVPLLARVYPNGSRRREPLPCRWRHGLSDARAAGRRAAACRRAHGHGPRAAAFTQEPWLNDGQLAWRAAPASSGDLAVLRPAGDPFSTDGGLRLLQGNLGRSVVKVSAVKPEHRVVRAPAVVVADQQDLLALYQQGRLQRDFIAVVRYQGRRPTACPNCTS
jgi:phosphogluconate dehydratase